MERSEDWESSESLECDTGAGAGAGVGVEEKGVPVVLGAKQVGQSTSITVLLDVLGAFSFVLVLCDA